MVVFTILWYKGKRKSESYERVSKARRNKVEKFLIFSDSPYDVSDYERGGRMLEFLLATLTVQSSLDHRRRDLNADRIALRWK